MSKTISGSNFTVKQMWDMSQRKNETWGVSGYEVPVDHFDYARSIRNKKNFDMSTGKKKRPPGSINLKAKRGDIFETIQKKALEVPGPWKYDIKDKWITGYKKSQNANVASKPMQKMKFKWKKTKPEDMAFDRPAVQKAGKLNMKISKNTYIDQIFKHNSRKKYPLPGPGTYYKDKILLKKLDPEVADLVSMYEKNTNKAKNLPQAKRELSFIGNIKEVASKPGPGAYTMFEKKIKETSMGYKDYKRKIVEDRARRKEVLGREKERLDEVKENLKGELPKHPNPIPQDRVTFDHYKKIYKNVKKGGDKAGQKHFGGEPRFAKSVSEKWQKTVKLYNDADIGKTLDGKKDRTPGPAHYSLISSWTGKGFKNKKQKLPNIFKTISTKPSLGIYNSRRY